MFVLGVLAFRIVAFSASTAVSCISCISCTFSISNASLSPVSQIVQVPALKLSNVRIVIRNHQHIHMPCAS